MGLLGRPRLYSSERPATNAERQQRFAQKRRTELLQLRNKDTIRVYHKATRTEVATPWHVFDRYNDEFFFTLDVCATAANTKCARFFSPADNGLVRDWGTDICWLNPPYGRAINVWMEKAYHSSLTGATVLALLPARTSNAWWHDWVKGKAEVRERRGRITFVGESNAAGFPSVAVIYRPLIAGLLPFP